MMKNSLYQIIQVYEPDGMIRIQLLRESRIYKAHFPEHPITPGVCIIQIATELIEDLKGENLALKEVVNAKFLAVIDPDITKELNYNLQKITPITATSFKVSVIVADSTTTFAKLSLVYEKK
ncbi:hydroxymyristoyl-ACP dehydratase [Bacteroides caecimuris]|uniref:hydroxymyristoyl-ACP dehydratase n=1 Tax=Bacteroides caecimuris TaxID=1796613 RepID=UPI002658D9F5|nr:hydroxymyristoyl-ACP dehydratase [Bacteroides caecimuris]